MSSDTRSRILEAAWKLLEDGAGSEVRMSDIAKKAGISRQAVYLHFPKRADLLIAVTRYIDEANEVDARLAASRGAATGVERLDVFTGNHVVRRVTTQALRTLPAVRDALGFLRRFTCG